jgi:BirA family biotin operon repressor/biotin-[acetyl-CoA-carboxylase] ligase
LAATDSLLVALEGRSWRSGAEIARALGVSRAAVWKRIAVLRRQGYEVEALAGKGYRLLRVTDRLLPAEVQRGFRPRRLRGEIVYRDEVDSTNALAATLARRGAVEGTVVIAERQSAGRGRLGRTWESPGHLNLYCSVILRPPMPPSDVPQLALVAAVAAAEAIERTIDAPKPAIKWPNDVLLDGRKAVGILTELDAETERVRFVILGIGVNLNARLGDFPPELRRKATSLALAAGRQIDRAAFTATLLNRLDRAYVRFLAGGFVALKNDYDAYHCLPGRAVRVEGGQSFAGVVRGVDRDGALLVEQRGVARRVIAGEVTLRSAYRTSRGAAPARAPLA